MPKVFVYAEFYGPKQRPPANQKYLGHDYKRVDDIHEVGEAVEHIREHLGFDRNDIGSIKVHISPNWVMPPTEIRSGENL